MSSQPDPAWNPEATLIPRTGLVATHPYLLWVADIPAYYRVKMPLRVLGGYYVESVVPRWDGRTGAPVLDMGDPTVVRLAGASGESVMSLLRAINGAGGNAWLEIDDDLSSLNPRDHAYSTAEGRGCDGPAFWVGYLRERETSFVQAMQAPRGVICSTATLAAVARQYQRRVLEFPNLVDPADFASYRRPDEDIVRIGFAGGGAHGGDVLWVLPALIECARLAQVELHFFGTHPVASDTPGMYEIAGVQYHFHGYEKDFFAFHKAIGILDVAIAPLRDIPLNRSRSACKWLEHSLHGTAMVVSHLPPYACVEHGVTGFRAHTVEEFGTYLRTLIQDADLRKRIGAAARAEVLRSHTPQTQGTTLRRRFEEAGFFGNRPQAPKQQKRAPQTLPSRRERRAITATQRRRSA